MKENNNVGIIMFEQESFGNLQWVEEKNLWRFDYDNNGSGERLIDVTIWTRSWPNVKKGNITEICLLDNVTNKNIVFEIVENKLNEEVFSPMNLEKTKDKIIQICQNILKLEVNDFDMNEMKKEIKKYIKKIFDCYPFDNVKIKRIDVYYGNGCFFGNKKTKNGQIRTIACIDSRCCYGFPGREKADVN